MKQKKIPMRMCVVTKEKYPKKELIRVVRTKEDTIVVDDTGKVNGHGAYIKKDIEVLESARKSKVLDRILEKEIKEEVYEELKELISE